MTPLNAAFDGDEDVEDSEDGEGAGDSDGEPLAGGEAGGDGVLGLRGERGASGGDFGEEVGEGVAGDGAAARTGTASFMPPRQ